MADLPIQPSPAAALELILPKVRPVDTERLQLELAFGRILAEDIRADRDSPAVDVSAMDGFALRSADLDRAELPIAGDLRIGQPPATLSPAQALRIVTGAPLPPGADVIIKREDVEEVSGRIRLSAAAKQAKPGANIRRRGENARAGAPVIGKGTEITPPVAGVLASCGIANVLVYRKVRIAVLVTGDEVLGVGDSPTPYQLRDSNGYSVAALLSRHAWVECTRAPAAKDDPDQLRAAMKALLDRADMLIATGGVSMGERDFVPQVVRSLGAEPLFHKVNQRPGKPIFAATLTGRPIFGLPGNPLSVMVTARRMVSPVLDRLGGLARSAPPPLLRIEPDGRKLDMWWHRFIRITGPGSAELLSISSSGDIINAAASDGFIEIPPDQAGPGPWAFYSWGN